MFRCDEKVNLVLDALSSRCISEEELRKSKKSCDMAFNELSSVLETSGAVEDRAGRRAINYALDYISKLEKNNRALSSLVMGFGSGVSQRSTEEFNNMIRDVSRFSLGGGTKHE